QERLQRDRDYREVAAIGRLVACSFSAVVASTLRHCGACTLLLPLRTAWPPHLIRRLESSRSRGKSICTARPKPRSRLNLSLRKRRRAFSWIFRPSLTSIAPAWRR